MAVFLFFGPTGVGKTELAKSLAEFLFGNQANLIRLDMSEFMEEHSVSKLIGSPPGYVGYEEEGQLTGKLRSKPYSIVLLDEVEKAHPRILDIFLQVFDEGRITDAKGRTVDAKNVIFIMTSNIQQGSAKKLGFVAEREGEQQITQADCLREYFRPELLNRIDEQIVFRQLEEENVKEILRPMLEEISVRLEEVHHVSLMISQDAEDLLVREGYKQQFGVRELRRVVERFIQMPLSNLILSGKMKNCSSWQAVCDGTGISIVPGD